MKKLIISLFTVLMLLCTNYAYPQDSCRVLKHEISAKYQGHCKKGLANGKGFAEGIDKYEGRFKNGFPNGAGIYTWANGDTYNGIFKDGLRNGEGTFKYKKNGADSVLHGIWKNDVFVKKILPAPYKIYIARDFDRYSITKLWEGNKVSLKLHQMGNTNTDLSEFTFFADNGLYQTMGNTYIYYQVIFPVHIKISYTTKNKLKTSDINPVLEVIIYEAGEWEIILNN